jgi:hypothetical protein
MLQEIHNNPTLADMDNNRTHLKEIESREVSDASGNTHQRHTPTRRYQTWITTWLM